MAERLANEIEQTEGTRLPIGVLDITLYRDDLSTIAPQPVVKETRLAQPIDDQVLILCDDVLYTGRTIRAALDANQWRRSDAAAALGMSRTTLWRKMREHGLL